MVRGKASKQQRISGGRPRHVANFVGNHEASGSDEDCAFAFMVTDGISTKRCLLILAL